MLEAWLSARRGSKVTIGVPERGAKRKLMEVVNQNAAEAFHRHKLRRASDFGARSRALSELAEQLGLPQAPLRIECYDISNLGETDTVGSMVVFEDGLPKRSDYRRFEIKGVPGQDDFASMEEMLRRRFARLIRERDEPVASTRRRFAYPPSLVVVDGGKGQLGVCSKVLADVGLDIPHIGLAKRLEEVYFPDPGHRGRPRIRGLHRPTPQHLRTRRPGPCRRPLAGEDTSGDPYTVAVLDRHPLFNKPAQRRRPVLSLAPDRLPLNTG